MSEFKGFVGPAYIASNIMQDNQALINWFVEIDQTDGAKVARALLGCPGSADMGNTYAVGPARGFHVLPGGASAVAVFGNTAVLITVKQYTNFSTTAQAVQVNRPSFTYTYIGTLNTGSGAVGIRDNGAGQICAIVDGPYLYYYNFITKVFNISADPNFLGSNFICEIDGWFVFCKPNSQTFYTSPLYWNGSTAFDATYFALKDNASDNIVAMIENNRELWLVGENTTEIWYNAGGQYFPFSRLQGTMIQNGCGASQSISRWSGGLVWLAKSERGNNDILVTQGYQVKNIANPFISQLLDTYPVISDASAYVYNEEGHEFYVLSFPTQDITWCYDFSTGFWHQRASFNQADGQFHQCRASAAMNFQGMIITGDYQFGYVYWQTRKVYKDRNNPLVALRRTPHVWDKSDRNRVRYKRIQVEFTPGSALQATVANTNLYGTPITVINPQASLRWSDDGGQTWGNEHLAPIGTAGNTKTRTIWRKLGIARDRVFELRVSDPVNRDIVGASLDGEPLGA